MKKGYSITKTEQVFISHDSEDAQFVDRLADDLQRLGVQGRIASESSVVNEVEVFQKHRSKNTPLYVGSRGFRVVSHQTLRVFVRNLAKRAVTLAKNGVYTILGKTLRVSPREIPKSLYVKYLPIWGGRVSDLPVRTLNGAQSAKRVPLLAQ